MKHVKNTFAAVRKNDKPEPKFKLVQPSYAMNAGSATTDIIRP